MDLNHCITLWDESKTHTNKQIKKNKITKTQNIIKTQILTIFIAQYRNYLAIFQIVFFVFLEIFEKKKKKKNTKLGHKINH